MRSYATCAGNGCRGHRIPGWVFGAGEGAVGFFVEAEGDGCEGGGEEGVVLEVEGVYVEAPFNGGEGREHNYLRVCSRIKS